VHETNTINRVLNLETGSLAAEAALKMIMARFYRSEEVSEPPPYEGKTPVFLVIGTDDGTLGANYHGTTFLTQTMRGMWPRFFRGIEEHGLMRVCPIRPNSTEDLEAAFARYEDGSTKIAGFFHEIVMMNYGARRLTPAFLRRAYELCAEHDVATVVDEIQSCIWAPAFFLYHEYGLRPTFVVIGKGFPNGEYAASRILFSSVMDNLPQFGALVTNGQEELASLAYLVTMRWARANAEVTRDIGAYYEERLREFAAAYPEQISGVDGQWHLTTVCFHDVAAAKALTAQLSGGGLDVSVQTYKADCPPAVMMKLPLTARYEVVDFILERMHAGMKGLAV
jgi:4-aminobutyrate aminotransferase-like enzyme